MSKQRTNNFITVAAGIAIVFALASWFSTTSNSSTESVAENESNATQVEQKAIHVHSTDGPEEVVEEIIVVADELVEKAQEAADRNQPNENLE